MITPVCFDLPEYALLPGAATSPATSPLACLDVPCVLPGFRKVLGVVENATHYTRGAAERACPLVKPAPARNVSFAKLGR